MGLKKCTYCDGVTVIKAENMNDIQDAICDLERDAAEVPQLFAGALNGTAEGGAVTLRDVSPVEHGVAAEVSRKNWADLSTPYFNRFTEVVEQTEDTITVKATGTGTKWLQVCYLLSDELIGETLTLSATWTLSNSASQAAVRVQWVKSNGGTSGDILGYINQSGQTKTFTVTEKPADAAGLGLMVYSVADSTAAVAGDTVTYTGIQLEKGTIATPYSPFVSDPSVAKLRVLGKNLANKAEFVDYPTVRKYLPLELKAGTYYYSSNLHASSGVTFWTGIVPDGVVDYSGGYIANFSSFGGTQDEGAFTISKSGTYRFLIYCANADYMAALDNVWSSVWMQIELGTAATPYEPYQTPVEYEQGEAIPSVSPEMTITTDTDGALVSVEYNRDTNIAFNDLLARISAMEAAVVSNT